MSEIHPTGSPETSLAYINELLKARTGTDMTSNDYPGPTAATRLALGNALLPVKKSSEKEGEDGRRVA